MDIRSRLTGGFHLLSLRVAGVKTTVKLLGTAPPALRRRGAGAEVQDDAHRGGLPERTSGALRRGRQRLRRLRLLHVVEYPRLGSARTDGAHHSSCSIFPDARN